MDISYAMIGADGQQYGPISLEQIKSWVQEGRLTGDTKVLRSDSPDWRLANQFPELGFGPAAPTSPAPFANAPGVLRDTASHTLMDAEGFRSIRRGSSWFFWVAALSLINSIMSATGTGVYFLFGMGITLLTSRLTGDPTVGIALNVVICGLLAACGWFARKGQSWAFIAGIVIYGLDAVVFLVAQRWLPLAFHGYVMFWMVRGMLASFQMKSKAA